MLVVGGYNSSNTISLAAICAERVPTYHIADPESIDTERATIRYRPAGLQSCWSGWPALSTMPMSAASYTAT